MFKSFGTCSDTPAKAELDTLRSPYELEPAMALRRYTIPISRIQAEYRTLGGGSLEEVRPLVTNYRNHIVCERALTNPDPAVQALAREVLSELAAEGDRYSRETLARLEAA